MSEQARFALFLSAKANNPQLSDAEVNALIDDIPDRAPKVAKRRRFVGARPRKPEHVQRRRQWAASGKMPATLATSFTTAELSVLAVVAQEHRIEGQCTLSNGELADIAGVSVTTARRAIREAKALGLIAVQERRVSRCRNDTNVVRIVSAEWLAWLRFRTGVQSETRSKIQISKKGERSPVALERGATGLTIRQGERAKPLPNTYALAGSGHPRGAVDGVPFSPGSQHHFARR